MLPELEYDPPKGIIWGSILAYFGKKMAKCGLILWSYNRTVLRAFSGTGREERDLPHRFPVFMARVESFQIQIFSCAIIHAKEIWNFSMVVTGSTTGRTKQKKMP
jgi:hypothetical protein